MFAHHPLPRPVLNAIINGRIFAQRAGATQIEPAHILAAVRALGSVVMDVEQPRALGLSAASKLALAKALEAAGCRDAVTMDHLRSALQAESPAG